MPGAVLALCLYTWNLGFGLPFLFRPDEDVMVGRAVRMAAEHTLDPLFYIYPPLAFYLFAGAEAVLAAVPGQHLGPTTQVAPGAEILAARLVSAAAALATVLLTAGIARRAYGRAAALVAGGALAVAPLAVRQAHFATTDFITTAFVAASIRVGQRATSRRQFALAGALAGFAVATKYTGGAALAFVLWAALAGPDRRGRAGAAVLGAGAAVAALLAPLAGHWREYWEGVAFLAGRSREFGYLPLGGIYHMAWSLPFGLGLGGFGLALAGVIAAVLHRRRDDLALLAFLVVAAAPLALSHEVFFRYVLPLLPALCALAGGALRLVPAGALRLALPVALLLLLPAAFNSFAGDRLLGMTDTRRQAADWLDANAPAGAHLEIDSYWGQPFYDAAEIGHSPLHPLYASGDPVADSFQQGLYSGRYTINRQSPGPCYRLVESGPPWQSLTDPPPGAGRVAEFSPGRPAPGATYDQLDSFYLPIWGFEGLDRPGPSIVIDEGCR